MDEGIHESLVSALVRKGKEDAVVSDAKTTNTTNEFIGGSSSVSDLGSSFWTIS